MGTGYKLTTLIEMEETQLTFYKYNEIEKH